MLFNKYEFQGRGWFDPIALPLVLCCAWRPRLPNMCAQCLALTCLGPLALALVSEFHPLLNGKTLSWAYVFMLVCAGVGCSTLGRLRKPALALLIGVQLYAVLNSETRDAEGWRRVAALLRMQAQPGDVLYLSSAASILLLRHYGWPEAKVHIVSFASPAEEPWFRESKSLTFVSPRSIPRQIAGGPRIWLLTRHQPALHAAVAACMDRNAGEQLHQRMLSLELSLFVPVRP